MEEREHDDSQEEEGLREMVPRVRITSSQQRSSRSHDRSRAIPTAILPPARVDYNQLTLSEMLDKSRGMGPHTIGSEMEQYFSGDPEGQKAHEIKVATYWRQLNDRKYVPMIDAFLDTQLITNVTDKLVLQQVMSITGFFFAKVKYGSKVDLVTKDDTRRHEMMAIIKERMVLHRERFVAFCDMMEHGIGDTEDNQHNQDEEEKKPEQELERLEDQNDDRMAQTRHRKTRILVGKRRNLKRRLRHLKDQRILARSEESDNESDFFEVVNGQYRYKLGKTEEKLLEKTRKQYHLGSDAEMSDLELFDGSGNSEEEELKRAIVDTYAEALKNNRELGRQEGRKWRRHKEPSSLHVSHESRDSVTSLKKILSHTFITRHSSKMKNLNRKMKLKYLEKLFIIVCKKQLFKKLSFATYKIPSLERNQYLTKFHYQRINAQMIREARNNDFIGVSDPVNVVLTNFSADAVRRRRLRQDSTDGRTVNGKLVDLDINKTIMWLNGSKRRVHSVDNERLFREPFYITTDAVYALTKQEIVRHRDVIKSMFLHAQGANLLQESSDMFTLDETFSAIFDASVDSQMTWMDAARYLHRNHYYRIPGPPLVPVDSVPPSLALPHSVKERPYLHFTPIYIQRNMQPRRWARSLWRWLGPELYYKPNTSGFLAARDKALSEGRELTYEMWIPDAVKEWKRLEALERQGKVDLAMRKPGLVVKGPDDRVRGFRVKSDGVVRRPWERQWCPVDTKGGTETVQVSNSGNANDSEAESRKRKAVRKEKKERKKRKKGKTS